MYVKAVTSISEYSLVMYAFLKDPTDTAPHSSESVLFERHIRKTRKRLGVADLASFGFLVSNH